MDAPASSLVDQLAGQPVAFLCTLRPDGSPHQTPVWFVFTAETWWVATAGANAAQSPATGGPQLDVEDEDEDYNPGLDWSYHPEIHDVPPAPDYGVER